MGSSAKPRLSPPARGNRQLLALKIKTDRDAPPVRDKAGRQPVGIDIESACHEWLFHGVCARRYFPPIWQYSCNAAHSERPAIEVR